MTPRARKCKVCTEPYIPRQPMQRVCGVECARAEAVRVREKAERKEDKARRERIKTRSDWLKEAQTAFNAYVRARDAKMACICCGRPLFGADVGGSFDAGHYRSVGSAPHLRFDEDNCHGQTKQCNRWGAGRAVDYRIGLIQRIGLEAVERIEADQTPRKWTIDELKAIKAEYTKRAKEMKT